MDNIREYLCGLALLLVLPFSVLAQEHTTKHDMHDTLDVRLGYAIIYVKDVESTLHFYERTFGFERKLLTPEKDYGELATGSTTLAFASESLAQANFDSDYVLCSKASKAFAIELAFTTKDVDRLVALAVENGASILKPAEEKPWGQRVAYLKDVNGFIVEVCSFIN